MGPVGAAVARHLTFEYGRDRRRPGAPAGIADVSFSVPAGRVVGVLGPNGAGKSTLLRLLATALRPDAGSLRLLGEDASRASASLRRRIGYVPSESAHLESLSGRENAIWFARAAGISGDDARHAVDAFFAAFGLTEYAALPARTHSHGSRRKLLLCAAFVRPPGLLVLDEPTLGLDPDAVGALETAIADAAARGAGVLVASNEPSFVQRTCGHVLFLDAGRIVLEGAPAELLAGVGHAAWIRIAYRAAAAPTFERNGVRLLHATEEEAVFRAEAGSGALPELCAGLLAQGVEIRAVEVREPDLGDVFRSVTGHRSSSP